MVGRLIFLLLIGFSTGSHATTAKEPLNCGCPFGSKASHCGIEPAFMTRNSTEIYRDLGFEVAGDNSRISQKLDAYTLSRVFANFLENSDHARALNPAFYTRAAIDASELTLKTKYRPKNPNETDEYMRCTLPADKYCLYKKSLRPYIGLAAKASSIPYSFMACQSYVESRYNQHARSSIGALGYAQIRETNISYLNEVLQRSIHRVSRAPASESGPRATRMRKAHQDIADLWKQFWHGTQRAPANISKCDLTCYRQVFLAQALSLKSDMLALATSSRGLTVDYDKDGNFLIEKMDKGDSLLVLAASYNVGVSNMIRLVSQFCTDSSTLKDCLEKIQRGKLSDPALELGRQRDVAAFRNYVMRIRDCSQRFSAEQIDFDDDDRWTHDVRTEKQNEQRDQVVQCLAKPCPFPKNQTASTD